MEFNTSVLTAHDSREAWTRSALQVALKLVGDRHSSRERTIKIESEPETFSNARITITEEGLMDDSIRGVRFELTLQQAQQGYWLVETAKTSFRCWPGRGHDDYSDEPCQ